MFKINKFGNPPKVVKLLLCLTLVAISFVIFNPIEQGNISLSNSDYTFTSEDVNSKNTWSKFNQKKAGVFDAHSGAKKPSQGILVFQKDLNLTISTAIAQRLTKGSVQVSILLNGVPQSQNIVSHNNPKTIKVKVQKGNTLRIKVDKNGTTNSDWTEINIVRNNSFTINASLGILLLWSLIFFVMLIKGYLLTLLPAYLLFGLMIWAEDLNFGSLAFDELWIHSCFAFLYALFIVLINQEKSALKVPFLQQTLKLLVTLTFFLIPVLLILHFNLFQKRITKESIYALFQTNISEGLEFIEQFVSLGTLLLGVLLLITPVLLVSFQSKFKTTHINRTSLAIAILFLTVVNFNNRDQFKIFQLPVQSFSKYYAELQGFKELQAKRKTGDITIEAHKENQGETYVIIIGESLNKNHMGIYGYSRNTTPKLSKILDEDELIIFNNAYAADVHTVPVLSLALTEANILNKKEFFKSPSIINLFGAADIETHWLSNQNMKGIWDNAVSILANEADNVISVNHSIGKTSEGQNYDEALILKMEKVLSQKTKKNRAIFIHLMGNHTAYCRKFPKELFSRFTADLDKGEFGNLSNKKILKRNLNCYDNSVAYNDFVVSELLNLLKSNNLVSSLVYMSDHSDDVISRKGHNAGTFTYDMTEIPLLFWLSDSYKKTYPNKYQALKKNRQKLFSNDLFYETLLGLTSVNTPLYSPSSDLTSPLYKLRAEEAFTLSGQKKYASSKNFRYWQRKNSNYLIKNNLSNRVFPHKINSTAKLNEIWNEGFRSFEIDVNLIKGKLIVGHESGVMGYDMKKFLKSVDTKKITKIWIDFKNLTPQNLKIALKELESINNEFQLREKTILEFLNIFPAAQTFAEHGWRTSFYLPVSKIHNIQKKPNRAQIKQFAKYLNNLVKDSKASAISFDGGSYKFVKSHLEPLLDSSIVYHTWYGPKLKSTNFAQELQRELMFQDSRVHSILSPYESAFDL